MGDRRLVASRHHVWALTIITNLLRCRQLGMSPQYPLEGLPYFDQWVDSVKAC